MDLYNFALVIIFLSDKSSGIRVQLENRAVQLNADRIDLQFSVYRDDFDAEVFWGWKEIWFKIYPSAYVQSTTQSPLVTNASSSST